MLTTKLVTFSWEKKMIIIWYIFYIKEYKKCAPTIESKIANSTFVKVGYANLNEKSHMFPELDEFFFKLTIDFWLKKKEMLK